MATKSSMPGTISTFAWDRLQSEFTGAQSDLASARAALAGLGDLLDETMVPVDDPNNNTQNTDLSPSSLSMEENEANSLQRVDEADEEEEDATLVQEAHAEDHENAPPNVMQPSSALKKKKSSASQVANSQQQQVSAEISEGGEDAEQAQAGLLPLRGWDLPPACSAYGFAVDEIAYEPPEVDEPIDEAVDESSQQVGYIAYEVLYQDVVQQAESGRAPGYYALYEPEAAAVELPSHLQSSDSFGSFNLRVVFSRNKTGLEATKEFTPYEDELIGGRYAFRDVVGEAASSIVMRCVDTERGDENVSVKCINNDKEVLDQALDEIKLLRYINESGDPDEHHVLRMTDHFYFREHLFIVGELLRDNLYDYGKFIQDTQGEPYFTNPNIRTIVRQVLEALRFVHSLGLLHCDVKPENIVIKSYSRVEVKLIDFGASCFQTDHPTTYVQSRAYRAPEVILGCPYDGRIDVWSIGCVAAELLTGSVLMENVSLATLLAKMASLRGAFPAWMVQTGTDAHQYFHGPYLIDNAGSDTCTVLYPRRVALEQVLPEDVDPDFVSFLEQTLDIDAKRRPTAEELLNHEWFQHA